GDDGYQYLTLYLPDVVLKFESEDPLPISGREPRWVGRDDPVPHSLRVAPVTPLENKPGLIGGGPSDLEPAIPLQNAVNKLCADMIVASEYGAFPQRVLTGVEIPRDPETGKVLNKVQVEAAM